MNRRLAVVAAGVIALTAGSALAVFLPGLPAGSVPLTLAGLAGVGLVLYRLLAGGDGAAAPPWTDAGALVDEAPERTPERPPLAGTELDEAVADGVAAARETRRVADGLDHVRPVLRRVLRTAVDEAAIAAGAWTDDAVAASVLADGIDPPRRGFRERLRAWLRPGRVVRARSRRAAEAVAETAARRLPPVVGQDAPRTVPELRPRVETLSRGPTGERGRAVDPRPGPEAVAGAGTEEPAAGEVDTDDTGGEGS
jgi:hypothetical protein